jgi:hypothetical protein
MPKLRTRQHSVMTEWRTILLSDTAEYETLQSGKQACCYVSVELLLAVLCANYLCRFMQLFVTFMKQLLYVVQCWAFLLFGAYSDRAHTQTRPGIVITSWQLCRGAAWLVYEHLERTRALIRPLLAFSVLFMYICHHHQHRDPVDHHYYKHYQRY